MSFGENLKKFRAKAGLTQSELAARVYVTDAAICAFEANKKAPSLALALGIAKELGTTVEALFGGKM